MDNKVQGYDAALKILQKNLSQRAKALASLEKYVDGTQYEGLPDWFSDKKPLWERAPCIVYPIVKSAIDSNSDLLLGEGRFPSAKVDGLSGEQADGFEKAVARVVQQSRLKAAAREVFAAGQGCGSACAVFGLRKGRLFIDTLLARWCEPVLDAEGAVESVEVRYPYLAIVKDTQGNEKYVCKLYRRTIDAVNDTTYLLTDAREDGTEPDWRVDAQRTVAHELGFCPVVWFPHLKGCAAVNDFDGQALHEHLTDEIRAHDFALSQRHRAALYAGDPQWTEIGVAPGYNPTGTARKAEVPASVFGRPGERAHASYVSEPVAGKARKKSPGTVWQYEGKATETKVQLHTLPGDALKALDDHARDLRTKLAESLGVVFLDPETLPNESRLSGKALESFKGRQLDRVNYYRSDFGDRFLLPGLGMLIRIAIHGQLKIEGLEIIKAQVAATPEWSWHAPPIDLLWGDYFQPSGEEEELLVRAGVEAITGGIATRKVIVEKLHSVLGIRDVESYMAELEAERTKNQEEAITLAQATKPPAPPKGEE
jgi:hypothetical protein